MAKITELSDKQRKRLDSLPPDMKEKMAKILADEDDDDDEDSRSIQTAFHIDLSDKKQVAWAKKKGVLTDEDIADLFPEDDDNGDDKEKGKGKKKRMIDRWAGDDDDDTDDDKGDDK